MSNIPVDEMLADLIKRKLHIMQTIQTLQEAKNAWENSIGLFLLELQGIDNSIDNLCKHQYVDLGLVPNNLIKQCLRCGNMALINSSPPLPLPDAEICDVEDQAF
jgi:hypothetical protein